MRWYHETISDRWVGPEPCPWTYNIDSYLTWDAVPESTLGFLDKTTTDNVPCNPPLSFDLWQEYLWYLSGEDHGFGYGQYNGLPIEETYGPGWTRPDQTYSWEYCDYTLLHTYSSGSSVNAHRTATTHIGFSVEQKAKPQHFRFWVSAYCMRFDPISEQWAVAESLPYSAIKVCGQPLDCNFQTIISHYGGFTLDVTPEFTGYEWVYFSMGYFQGAYDVMTYSRHPWMWGSSASALQGAFDSATAILETDDDGCVCDNGFNDYPDDDVPTAAVCEIKPGTLNAAGVFTPANDTFPSSSFDYPPINFTGWRFWYCDVELDVQLLANAGFSQLKHTHRLFEGKYQGYTGAYGTAFQESVSGTVAAHEWGHSRGLPDLQSNPLMIMFATNQGGMKINRAQRGNLN